jgi:kumamolisin
MTRHFHRTALATSLAVAFASFSSASLAANAQPDVDMGVASGSQTTTVTLTLKLHNQPALEQYIQDTVTPGSAHFQQFLTTSQFASQYGATAAEIAQVQTFLKQKGLTSQVLDNHMTIRATGTLAQFGAAFSTPIHSYVSTASGQRFHRPSSTVLLPSAVANLVVATSGLNSEKKYLSHRIQALNVSGVPTKPSLKSKLATTALTETASASTGNPTATGEPGSFTVGDVANFYNINPLYKHGVTGKGSTVAIVTLSNFYPADAQTYWTDIGLTTKPNRITQVHIDGGSVIDDGSGETALDVEQSGGLAPDADIIVYDAPNAGNGFVDAFAQAVSDNKADSISTSWGGPEIYNFAALNVTGASVTDTSDVGDLQTFHQIFLEAAAQGSRYSLPAVTPAPMTPCAASAWAPHQATYTAPLTVDSPASDPYITAAGGTTRSLYLQLQRRTHRLDHTGKCLGLGLSTELLRHQLRGWGHRPVFGRRRRRRQRLLAHAVLSAVHVGHPYQRNQAVAGRMTTPAPVPPRCWNCPPTSVAATCRISRSTRIRKPATRWYRPTTAA